MAGRRLFEGVAGDIDVLVPCHGSVGGADQVHARTSSAGRHPERGAPTAPGQPGAFTATTTPGGASYSPTVGVLGAERTSQIKGISLRVDSYVELLNLDQ
ncbi:MAG: hypothetical protein ABIQ18_06660 [Umezawaea sp.]